MLEELADLQKARKAKGLENWASLDRLSNKLAGKKSLDITFTCVHPTHTSPKKHNLGSSEGNYHFLLGYANPGFHVASYHWHIIYPELSEEDLTIIRNTLGHPSRPVLWKLYGEDTILEPEGDIEDGTPHPYYFGLRKIKDIKNRAIRAKSRYGTYVADPVSGIVQEIKTEKVYSWQLIKDSFFAYENPEIAAAMEPEKQQKSVEVPEVVKHLANTVETTWESTVYPLIKSILPQPGSVISFRPTPEANKIYGIVTPTSLDLVTDNGLPVVFTQYDKEYSSFDLTKSSDLHPSILFNFLDRYLNIDGEHLCTLIKSSNTIKDEEIPPYVYGIPSPGSETLPAKLEE